MDTVTRAALETALENADVMDHDNTILPDYSGRGMYGRTCLGLILPADATISVCIELALHLEANVEDRDWVAPARTDSMGYDTVVYWPGVTLVD